MFRDVPCSWFHRRLYEHAVLSILSAVSLRFTDIKRLKHERSAIVSYRLIIRAYGDLKNVIRVL